MQRKKRQRKAGDDSLANFLGSIVRASRQIRRAIEVVTRLEQEEYSAVKLDKANRELAVNIYRGELLSFNDNFGLIISDFRETVEILFAIKKFEQLVLRITTIFIVLEQLLKERYEKTAPAFPSKVAALLRRPRPEFEELQWYEGIDGELIDRLAKVESWEEASRIIAEIETTVTSVETTNDDKEISIWGVIAAARYNPLIFDNNLRNVAILEATLKRMIEEFSGIDERIRKLTALDIWQSAKVYLSEIIGPSSKGSSALSDKETLVQTKSALASFTLASGLLLAIA
ncbi:MAG: hypothetical protein KJ977_00235, partial [Candidatus Omnitrophica bacterium]|nr:hypothetical protein [Candidatus Omnitrophota bacterium]